VEAGSDLTDALAIDVASLLKQFFRELPDPLLTSVLYDVFVQCVGAATMDGMSASRDAVLLACLLLPDINLATLRYLVTFLKQVAANRDCNLMDARNLAVCLAPNLLYSEHASVAPSAATDSRQLEVETTVIQLLIENAAHVGMVSDSIIERASLFNICFTLAGDSSNSENAGVIKTGRVVKKKKKQRSGSLQGGNHISYLTECFWCTWLDLPLSLYVVKCCVVELRNFQIVPTALYISTCTQ